NPRAVRLARILPELGSQPLEKREGIGGGACEAADHVALAQRATFFGIGFHNGLSIRDLSVPADGNDAAFADCQDGSPVPGRGLRGLHRSRIPVQGPHVGPRTTRRNSQRYGTASMMGPPTTSRTIAKAPEGSRHT